MSEKVAFVAKAVNDLAHWFVFSQATSTFTVLKNPHIIAGDILLL